MLSETELIELLKADALTVFGRAPETPADFNDLAVEIKKVTDGNLSRSTLMRLFGYVKTNHVPSRNTLSIVARYARYCGWADFVNHKELNLPNPALAPSDAETSSSDSADSPSAEETPTKNPAEEITEKTAQPPQEPEKTEEKIYQEVLAKVAAKYPDYEALASRKEAASRKRSIWKTVLATLILSLVILSLTIWVVHPHQKASTVSGWIWHTAGDSLHWSLNSKTGILTISGQGQMKNFEKADTKEGWKPYQDQIRSIVVENGVTSIGNNAFRRCEALRSVKLPESVTVIHETAFDRCILLDDIKLPKGLITLDNAAFYGCENLKEITIPSGITSLSFELFSFCTSMERCFIEGNVKLFCSYAFAQCHNLKEVTLPSSLQAIDTSCFTDCVSLEEMELPEGLVRVGEYAFHKCTSLRKVVIPSTVREVRRAAFEFCQVLDTIEVRALKEPDLGTAAFLGLPPTATLITPAGIDYSNWLEDFSLR